MALGFGFSARQPGVSVAPTMVAVRRGPDRGHRVPLGESLVVGRAPGCDLVLAARGARFMLPETHLGLFGTGGVAALLPRQAGLGRAKGILMLGEAFGARKVITFGLVLAGLVFVSIALLQPDSPAWILLVSWFFLGFGLGNVIAPSTTIACPVM